MFANLDSISFSDGLILLLIILAVIALIIFIVRRR